MKFASASLYSHNLCVFNQDKYILGSMFILFSCCIWHGVVGAIINRVTAATAVSQTTVTPLSTPVTEKLTTNNESFYTTRIKHVTSMSITTGSALVAVKASSSTKVTPEAQLADYIALGIFLTVYMVFHLVFGVLIFCAVSKPFRFR
jgi:hypothetical protein